MLSLINILMFDILFLIPGLLLSVILFPHTNVIQRITFGLAFSVAIFSVITFLNSALGSDSMAAGIAEYSIITGLLLIWIYIKNLERKTLYTPDIWFLVVASIIGTIWKLLFTLPIKHISSAYDYAGLFTKENVPDLGFYTGMAQDHANYALETINTFWSHMENTLSQGHVSLFLITFLYLGFIYILAENYRQDRKITWLAVIVMMFAPIEIFYTSGHIFGHPIAYITVFSLFLLYKTPSQERITPYIVLAASLSTVMAITYYTSTLVTILLSSGFIISIFIEKIIQRRNQVQTMIRSVIQDVRFKGFLLILVITSFIFLIIKTDLIIFTKSLVREAAQTSITITTGEGDNHPIRPYVDPNIFGISALRAQVLFFLVCGLSFVFYISKRRRRIEELDKILILTLIPISIVSLAFLSTGYPARAFDYFAFFALFLIRFPKKYFAGMAIFIIIFISATGLMVMRDKRIFFDRSPTEIEGAAWIVENIYGKVFSDQIFINLLVTKNFYTVAGVSDTDPRLTDLFYQPDLQTFILAVSSNLDIDYIVTTKRMREKFILMLDTPQLPIANKDLIDTALEKVYDNGDVRVYSTR